MSGDWPLHVLNPHAVAWYAEEGLAHLVTSPEDESANLADLLGTQGGRLQVLVAQFSPLFVAATGPAGLEGAFRLRNRGQEYVELAEPGQHVLVNRAPFWLAHQVDELAARGVGGFRVDLSRAVATGGDPGQLWKAARKGERLPGSHEGNYRRGLK